MLTLAAALALAAPPASPPLTAVAYRPDGQWLAAGGYGTVAVLDAAGTVLGRLPGQDAAVTAVAFSPDGRRLAVASGTPGKAGTVRLYLLPPTGLPAAPDVTIPAHADSVLDLAFSPDGRALATCSYDRLVKLWDASTGAARAALKDHSDSVYALAFRPGGALLASAGADRAVKVWDVASGRRLFTLSDSTDWVYAVSWSPDGKRLAAGGADKSVRVWEVDADGGRLVGSAFAHDKPVLKLAHSPDGRSLVSLSEDRTVKLWDADKLTERLHAAPQPDAVLAMALRPDGKQLALARYDGGLALTDAATGRVLATPLPEKPKPPVVTALSPNAGVRGRPVRVTFLGRNLDGVTAVKGLPAKVVSRAADRAEVELAVPASAAPGAVTLTLSGPGGDAAGQTFLVDRFPAAAERAGNDAPSTGTKVGLPAALVGVLDRAGDVDWFRFEARAGQEVGVQAVVPPGSKLEPVLQVADAAGSPVAEGDARLGFVAPRDGTFALGVRDRDYRGGADFGYRLQAGPVPVVTAASTLGGPRGATVTVGLEGVYLGSVREVKVAVPADAAPGSRLPLPVPPVAGEVPLGVPSLAVGEFPEQFAVSAGPGGPLAVPGTGNGVIDAPGKTFAWKFPARKGEPLVVEVAARRLGSPLDPFVEILDGGGKPVGRATLRCQAMTVMTLRDRDSDSDGLRVESYNELAVNDLIYVGNELLNLQALPRGPDDDAKFLAVDGKRVGLLGTTPGHLSLGLPMYKVTVHPPGTAFPPNGMPVFAVNYRNDDGGPGHGKDSYLLFDPPADGVYQARVGDSRGLGGAAYGYRLTVRPPRPDFRVRFRPTAPAVYKGGAVPVTVSVDRIDDFDGPVSVRLDDLPPGFRAAPTFVEAGQTETRFALECDPGVTVAKGARPFRVVATAQIGGQSVVREAAGGVPRAVEPGEIVTTTAQPAVTIRPGQEARLTVKVERRMGFKGRVPVEVMGLPHGVRVLNVGLNGILVTPAETSREIALYAEPWVEPMTHPIVVFAKREGKNTEHAAPAVTLRVER